MIYFVVVYLNRRKRCNVSFSVNNDYTQGKLLGCILFRVQHIKFRGQIKTINRGFFYVVNHIVSLTSKLSSFCIVTTRETVAKREMLEVNYCRWLRRTDNVSSKIPSCILGNSSNGVSLFDYTFLIMVQCLILCNYWWCGSAVSNRRISSPKFPALRHY